LQSVIELSDVRAVLASQKFAVLSTQEEDRPYLNLVAFAETDDLAAILFATTRATRKYANISAKSGVALLVDNRSNEALDVQNAMAITIIGKADEILSPQRELQDRVYLRKQPHMREFLCASTTALIKVDVERYMVVTRFQDVTVLNMKSSPHNMQPI
jgi:heme iron utilization protein